RKARLPLEPTTTVPSRLTSMAEDCVAPGRNPSPKKVGGCAARTARPGSRRKRVKTATRPAAFVRMPGLMAAPPAICPGCCRKDVPQERPIARDNGERIGAGDSWDEAMTRAFRVKPRAKDPEGHTDGRSTR